ncbi:MarR family winged helix-turn-helix transcriptional regulator [Streptomyces cinereospinus]|uniref:MarR family winged helix-turn-helix transcriptional regulator n=1 Tax=Streptomyces cinereospinus TaxID=285561 RepID=A0ABV5MXN6_9ACTN
MPDSDHHSTQSTAGTPGRLDATSLMVDAVFRMERAVVRLQNQRLSAWNMTLSGYAALRVLAERPELSLAQLARRCHVRPQTMARIVTALEERGFMARSPHPESQRAISLMVTPEGRTVLDEMTRAVNEIQTDLAQVLPPDQAELLNTALRSCAAVLETQLRHLA